MYIRLLKFPVVTFLVKKLFESPLSVNLFVFVKGYKFRHLNVAATARASFYLYNTNDDVDRLVDALYEARKVFGLDG